MSDTRIRKAAQALIARLDEIHDHPSYLGVYQSAFVHGVHYTGPTYEDQLKELRAAVEDDNE